MKEIYLDFNASTPVDPRVADVARQFLAEAFGNPSSTHWAGVPAREAVGAARQQVAGLLGCSPGEIVFTSGGSESNNLAIKGMYFRQNNPRAHIVTTRIEHPAIVGPCRFLERLGAQITWLPVDSAGRVDPDELCKAMRADTVLVSIMHANNEVGTVQPIGECARIARDHGVPFHTDAAQSAGKIPVLVDPLGVDLLTIAGHKMYAPKGVGALYVRDGLDPEPLIHGAGHENGRRAGTESALLCAALGEACELAGDLPGVACTRELRDRFWSILVDRLGDRVVLNGHPDERLPNTLNVSFIGRTGADILAAIPEIAASTGSACHEGTVELSPVLEAMGVPHSIGAGAVRFSLGRTTTRQQVETAAALLIRHLETTPT